MKVTHQASFVTLAVLALAGCDQVTPPPSAAHADGGALVGTWSGVFEQQPAGQVPAYPVEIVFSSATSGQTRYPSLRCTGALSGGPNGGAYQFHEAITAAAKPGACSDGDGEFTLSGDTLIVKWKDPANPAGLLAAGTLHRGALPANAAVAAAETAAPPHSDPAGPAGPAAPEAKAGPWVWKYRSYDGHYPWNGADDKEFFKGINACQQEAYDKDPANVSNLSEVMFTVGVGAGGKVTDVSFSGRWGKATTPELKACVEGAVKKAKFNPSFKTYSFYVGKA